MIVLCGIAFCISFGVTPIVIRLARHLKIVDRPDGHRKLHGNSVPLGGGAGIWLSIFATLAIGSVYDHFAESNLFPDFEFLVALLMASTTICVVGLMDDRFELRGRQKLLGQVFAVSFLIAAGFIIENVKVFGWHIQLGLLALPFTYFWMLGAINALNLIDGMDGLATSVGIVLSAAMAGMAALSGHHSESVLAMVILASLIGFLPYNFPPARIYLGDTGSMLIGLLLGALAIQGSLKGPATVALAAPVAIWAILIFDVGMAVLRRKLTGQSLYAADRGHLHHCLLRKGYGNKKALIWISGLCALTSCGALLGVYTQNEMLGIVWVSLVLGTLILSRFFGHSECRLLIKRSQSLIQSLVPIFRSQFHRQGEFQARLDGTREWEDLWQSVIEFADRFDIVSVKLNVSLPVLREEYHAQWTRREVSTPRRLWSTEIPLIAQNMTVGRLQIQGDCPADEVCAWMGDLISGLKPVEALVQQILDDESPVTIPKRDALKINKKPILTSAIPLGDILEGSQV